MTTVATAPPFRVGLPLAVVLAATSGAAISLAYPSADLGWLAWFALVPLCIALEGRTIAAAAGLGAVYATVTAVGIFGWLFVVPGVTVLRFGMLAVYVAVFPIAWCAAVVALGRGRMPLVPCAAAAWAVLEALRGHAGFLSLNWATLAQTQHRDVPFLQLAAWTGEAGLSFVVVAVNVATACVLMRRSRARGPAVAAAIGVLALHAGGAMRMTPAGDGPVLRIAVVQPHIGIRERETGAGRGDVWHRLEEATRLADAAGADLIVWPETAIGDPQRDPALASDLARLSSSLSAALVTGAAESEKFAHGPVSAMTVAWRPTYNSALLVELGRVVGEPYRKRVLLPFGEYLPLRGVVAWPSWLAPADLVDGLAGADVAPFTIERGGRTVQIATLICWENTFARLARRATDDGARLVVHLANDAWFGDTRAAAQHDAISVMRAVENGIPFVVASNDGPSELIDARGRVVARLDRRARAQVVAAPLPLAMAGTFYSRHGDLFVACCALALALACARSVTSARARLRPVFNPYPLPEQPS